MIEFLFKSLDKYGKDASVLFSFVDFKEQQICLIKRWISDHYDTFDFSMINSTLVTTTSQLLNELCRLKEECMNAVLEIKRNSIEAEQKRNIRFNEEMNRMKKEMQTFSKNRKKKCKLSFSKQKDEIQSFKKQLAKMLKSYIYKGKTFPFNFDIFKQTSKHFFQNRKILKNVKNINLLNEEEEKIINLSDETIQAFINCCQNQMCQINMTNVFQLQFLSYKL
ncbi:hypothetical protein M9Y10_019387 [Tritrichomonas musculus]|uniref:Uncharacterized protein n=1 Tax=Tritrichomonas musculus TaxID=1915356 RepID=A0ABR2HKR4_9EUKA